MKTLKMDGAYKRDSLQHKKKEEEERKHKFRSHVYN